MSTHKQMKTAMLEEFLDEVRERAHELYQERVARGLHGDSMSDWLTAEKEMKKKYNIK